MEPAFDLVRGWASVSWDKNGALRWVIYLAARFNFQEVVRRVRDGAFTQGFFGEGFDGVGGGGDSGEGCWGADAAGSVGASGA
jgi:hypothetical protein